MDICNRNIKNEDKKNILELCYGRIEQISDELFIVIEDGKYGIIDIDNQVRFDFQSDMICKIGNKVFLKEGVYYNTVNLDNFKVSKNFFSSVKECGKALIVRRGYARIGVIGSNDKFIMPPIYRGIFINKIKATSIELYVVYEDRNFISEISLDGRYATRLDVRETSDPKVTIVSVDFEDKKTGMWRDDNYELKYELAYDRRVVTNKKFDEILYRNANVKYGLINTWKNGYAGLIREDGKIIIDNNQFIDIDTIGYKGICLVSEYKQCKPKWGVYKEDVGLTVQMVFDKIVIRSGVPITYLYRDYNGYDDWWILGNDGYVHRSIEDAFQIEKFGLDSSGEDNVYKINVYGNELLVNSKLEMIG